MSTERKKTKYANVSWSDVLPITKTLLKLRASTILDVTITPLISSILHSGRTRVGSGYIALLASEQSQNMETRARRYCYSDVVVFP